MATCDVIMLCVTFFIIGFSLGALAIITAQKDEEPLEKAYDAGYEKGKADEQKKVMQKLEEYRSKAGQSYQGRKGEFMRIRNMSYSDYGISDNEMHYILDFCRNSNEDQKAIIKNALAELLIQLN